MKLLNGRDVAEFVKARHARQIRSLQAPPRLAIVRQGATPATDGYLRAKQQYGQDVGAEVDCYTEAPDQILARITSLAADSDVTGIIVQLPFANDPSLIDAALDAVPPAKDVDGLAPQSPFEAATPKAILWLLAAYNISLEGRVAIVGQGRLVGRPLSDRLEASGCDVVRIDEHTPDLAAVLHRADTIISATGQPGIITSKMVKPQTVVVDAGYPTSDLAPELSRRPDLTITPNPGGVGPMTVAALFDNLLIAALQPIPGHRSR